MAAVSLTLHNLLPHAESYELTSECICDRWPGVSLNTPKSVKAEDGSVGRAWELKVHPPTITIPARGKVSGVPLAARHAPSIKAAVAAGTLRISEDGSATPVVRPAKSVGRSA